jgi:hypothetical protein
MGWDYYLTVRNMVPRTVPEQSQKLEQGLKSGIISKYALLKGPSVDIGKVVINEMAMEVKRHVYVKGFLEMAKYNEIWRAMKSRTPSSGATDKLNSIAWKAIMLLINKYGSTIKTRDVVLMLDSINMGFDDKFKHFIGIRNFIEMVRYDLLGYATTMAPNPFTPWFIISRLLREKKGVRDSKPRLSLVRLLKKRRAQTKSTPSLVGTRGAQLSDMIGARFQIKFKPLTEFKEATEALNTENDFYGMDFCALFTLIPFIEGASKFRTIQEALPYLRAYLMAHPSIWQYNSRFNYSQPTLTELRDFYASIGVPVNYVLMTRKGPIHVDHDGRITLLIYDGHVELWAGQPLYDTLIKDSDVEDYLRNCA